jgi:hypothetical protein
MFAETRVFFSWLNWSDSNISYIFKIVGRYWQDDNFSCNKKLGSVGLAETHVILFVALVEFLNTIFHDFYVLLEKVMALDHTAKNSWRLKISSGQELLCGSYFDGSFESFWFPAT